MPAKRGSFSSTPADLAFSAFTQVIARSPLTSSNHRYGSAAVSGRVACADDARTRAEEQDRNRNRTNRRMADPEWEARRMWLRQSTRRMLAAAGWFSHRA